MTDQPPAHKHRLYEDALALLIGTLLVALGLSIYSTATLLTGSTAGISLLIQYATGIPFPIAFFVVNLPFYALAVGRMGWRFTIATFIAVGLVSLFARMTPLWIELGEINSIYAAIMGGILIGTGLLALFRHRAGLGGVNILSVYLQDNYGLRAGYVQLAIDATIMVVALFVVDADRVLLSLLGAAVLNFILAINHRPGRYVGVS
ncbi:YitT family protein [Afifella marina]|uniref:Uncharacterized 5xTM membrane BCR, YitT family COG1284 n=1 Tax=Afifella marina DSM 2698 TaxID=1120955 RepID=A0A1G5MJ05_AFIMA|nr:YitT family protein [Afifella marina]MBK1623780.1 YitT family protein [Afifella marina DSM 2698]MBK1627304.1 YitT family protein [Afifella marina]MBK5918667.1 hypothetical protein [Afifella marina]RAI22713.1 hypothetical protein CH311_03350 [Afifella marina DSM 2698]SCZ25072.1 Uncharacterised 5xTM membrane BCR, YitT family COG1284 [Afifella marina DSM 2698]